MPAEFEHGPIVQVDYRRARREAFWMDVFLTVAGCESCRSVNTAVNWANEALKTFDETFDDKNPKPPG